MALPTIDDDLADDVFRVLGVDRSAPVEALVDAYRGWLPAGSTAKWAAIDDGTEPPGADPAAVVEARLGGSIESWACWPYCTVLAGLLRSAGHDVRLAVEHLRAGVNVPLVDYHSVLVVDGALVDAFLGPSAPVLPGEDVVRSDAWSGWVPGVRPDHLGTRGGSSIFRYRQLADHLDERDIRSFLAISMTHTGVGRRRTAHWLRAGRLWFVREDEDGAATLRATSGEGSPFTQTRPVIATGRFEDLVRTIDEPGSGRP